MPKSHSSYPSNTRRPSAHTARRRTLAALAVTAIFAAAALSLAAAASSAAPFGFVDSIKGHLGYFSDVKVIDADSRFSIQPLGPLTVTTIVNYDFNTGTSYATLSPTVTSGVTSTASSTEAFATFGGTASGANAFASNATAGNAIAMNNSNGTNTKYFQFQLGGASLSTYSSYKVYAQGQRSSSGAQTATLAYSTDGTTFTNFGTTQSIGTSFSELQFDVSAVSAINSQSAVYFRILASGATGTGTFRIDNFQVQANSVAGLTPPTLTAAVGATVDSNFNITFTDDVTWRATPPSVKCGSSTLTNNTDYTLAAGTLTLKPGGGNTCLQTAASPTITVVAAGYSDATVSQPIGPGAIATYAVSAVSPQAINSPFSATVTAKDQYSNTVTTDSSTVVTMTSGSGNVQFDSNGDTTFGDNTKTLASGTFTISTKNTVAETTTIIATDSGSKTGNVSVTFADPSLATDYFRSNVAAGDWATAGSWQSSHDNVTWSAATLVPDANSSGVLIRNGHNITVSTNVTTDDTTVEATGQITVSSTGTLVIANGTATPDMTVNGIVSNAGAVTPTGTISFAGGSKYQHNFTTSEGTIPTASWDPNSTAEILGYTTNTDATLGLAQTFGNFTWNCASQTGNLNLTGATVTAAGAFTMTSTGTGSLRLGSSTNGSIIAGSFTQSGGTLNLSNGTGNGLLKVAGTFVQSGGTINEGGSGTTNTIELNGASNQSFTAAGTISNTINYNLNNAAGITLGSNLTLNSGTTLTLTQGNITTGSNTVSLPANGTVSRTSGHVIGNFKKAYSASASKTFEVGTANGYSPVTVDATGSGDFTVKATEGAMPALTGGPNKLARYWTLTNGGLTSANLTFNYLAGDVTGTVGNYQFIKNSGGSLSVIAPDGTPTSTSATKNGVSSFSDWTLAETSALQNYTATFNGNGSTGGTMSPQVSNVAASLTANGFSRTAYSFSGWNTAANGSGTAYADQATFPFTADTTLYAQWRGSVTYNGNNATGGTAPTDGSSPYLAGATVTVLTNSGSLVRSGYTFAGWNTQAGGNGTDYAADGSATFTMNGDITLYAKWTNVSAPTITFTPIPNTTSTANPTVVVTGADGDGISDMKIFSRIGGGSFNAGDACTLATGTAISGTWNCTISGVLTSPSAIAYYVAATDSTSATAINPVGGALEPDLYTIGNASLPAGSYSSISLSDGASLGASIVVTGTLDLGGTVSTGANTLELGCSGTVAGAGGYNYVVGNFKKNLCGTGAFTFPVGTTPDAARPSMEAAGMSEAPNVPQPAPPAEYTPMTLTVNSGTFPAAVNVSVVDAVLIGLDPAKSATRYWDVTRTGGAINADLAFTYLDQDAAGNEALYTVAKNDGSTTAEVTPSSVNAGTNTGTATGVTSFSKWGIGVLFPTAANAVVSGRVTTWDGRGIQNAVITATDLTGNPRRTVITGPFGYYSVGGLEVGQSYVLTVSSKRYRFAVPSRIVGLVDNVASLDFVANP